ncbi:MAG: hypothetical protein EA417_16295 [Gammaproteobacteria bacterium]|nr:MAG: hypothetical protein EA417_16295 [Gammaproteobacteria bacterium]
MDMTHWQIWLVLALVFVAADIALAGGASGVLLVLALAALGAMLAALLGAEWQGQLLAAAVAGALATPLVLIGLRRLAWRSGSSARTDFRVSGRTFEVIRQRERIGIRVQGDFFPARCAAGEYPEPGDNVRVIRFEGITAVVEPAPSPEVP